VQGAIGATGATGAAGLVDGYAKYYKGNREMTTQSATYAVAGSLKVNSSGSFAVDATMTTRGFGKWSCYLYEPNQGLTASHQTPAGEWANVQSFDHSAVYGTIAVTGILKGVQAGAQGGGIDLHCVHGQGPQGADFGYVSNVAIRAVRLANGITTSSGASTSLPLSKHAVVAPGVAHTRSTAGQRPRNVFHPDPQIRND
jgi:hypothetical protein